MSVPAIYNAFGAFTLAAPAQENVTTRKNTRTFSLDIISLRERTRVQSHEHINVVQVLDYCNYFLLRYTLDSDHAPFYTIAVYYLEIASLLSSLGRRRRV
jgi:hypothetical protein